MRYRAFRNRSCPIVLTILSLVSVAPTRAQPANGPPLAPADLTGKTGSFQLTLTDRSPLSAPAQIAKRMHIKPADIGDDYDLSKQVFDLYIPPEPDQDGKYGLLTVIIFADGHGYAPEAWHPILDKYHLIWIGANNGIDEGQTPLHRVGPVLDSVYNAEKIFPIDQRRVYISLNTTQKATCGTGLLYPDVFTGTINALMLGWITKIPDEHTRAIWSSDNTPRPSDQLLALAKTRHFFLASRDDGDANTNTSDDLTFRRGYQASGFRHTKFLKVSNDDMGHWVNYKSNWLEAGIQFLDEDLDKVKVASDPSSAPATQPEPTVFSDPHPAAPSAPTAAAPPPDDSTAKAASALSVANSYIAAQKYDIARLKLQKIIDTYPNTPAAKEAKITLAQIQGK